MATKNTNKKRNGNGANLGFETQLWAAADALRNNMDAAEYKHVVLGLIFLKYISDAFEERHGELLAEKAQGADPEDPDEYRAANVFWVPAEARWSKLKDNAKQPTIGKAVDDAMVAIERDNPTLKGVLPRDYARPALDKERLGQLIDLVSNIGLGDKESRSKDILGRVYEYFLSQFASAEGKKGGQFYTPRSVVQLLVQMLGRLFVHAEETDEQFVRLAEITEGLMMEVIGPLGSALTLLPAGPSYPGLNAGASFRLSRGASIPTHSEPAWSVFHERLTELVSYCRFLQGQGGAPAVLARVQNAIAKYAERVKAPA